MPIEVECSGCNKRLRVGDEHAGQQAKCPLCQTIFTVPDADSLPADVAVGGDFQRMHLKTPEGQIYGPVDKAELDVWVAEGRVSAACELKVEGAKHWQTAATVYPILQTPRTPNAGAAKNYSQAHADNPFAPKPSIAPAMNEHRHRGVMILVFGIVAWFTQCIVFGMLAWVMGRRDLREMKQGRMDSSGRDLTQVGMILGLVQCVLTAAVIVFYLAAILITAISSM